MWQENIVWCVTWNLLHLYKKNCIVVFQVQKSNSKINDFFIILVNCTAIDL